MCSPELLSEEVLLKLFHGNVQGKAARDEKVNAHPVIKVTDLECVCPFLSSSSFSGGGG
jgi:hypothetical protein